MSIPGAIRYGEDSFLIKGFLPNDQAYFRRIKNGYPWLDRALPEMAYRGNELNRTKFFLTRYRRKKHVYSYTGFQWASVRQYGCWKDYLLMRKLIKRLRPFGKYNHIIGTLYEHGADNIGFHSDKIRSWTPGTSVAILSLGATREFQLKRKSDEMITSIQFESGDLFVLGWKDNQTYQHSIPVVEKCEPRISLCFRDIHECYSLAELHKKMRSSEKAREHREFKKVEAKRAKLEAI